MKEKNEMSIVLQTLCLNLCKVSVTTILDFLKRKATSFNVNRVEEQIPKNDLQALQQDPNRV